ncbi:MAG: hypothetical protein AAF226_09530 [Verrucomicrobiota bacterium]
METFTSELLASSATGLIKKCYAEPVLGREQLLSGLKDLDDELRRQEVIGELAIYGGACMCLAF